MTGRVTRRAGSGDSPASRADRVLLVGECPGAAYKRPLPLFPLPPHGTGGRLCELLGMAPSEYLARFDRENLFSTHQARWSAPTARVRACEVVRSGAWRGRRVVLLGARLAAAFGMHRSVAPRLRWVYVEALDAVVGLVPHPSGLNRWYNVAENREVARTFILSVPRGRSRIVKSGAAICG